MVTATYNPIQTRRWHEKDPLYVSFRLGVIDLTMTAELNDSSAGILTHEDFVKGFSRWLYSDVLEDGYRYTSYRESFRRTDSLEEISKELQVNQHGRRYEQWRECPGISPDYQFSSFGRVRSKRGIKKTAARDVLVPIVNPAGGIAWRKRSVREPVWKIRKPVASRGKLVIGGLRTNSSFTAEGVLLPSSSVGVRNGYIYGGSGQENWDPHSAGCFTSAADEIKERLDFIILLAFYDLLGSVGHSAVTFNSSFAVKHGIRCNDLESSLLEYFSLSSAEQLTPRHVLQVSGLTLSAKEVLQSVKSSGNANWFFNIMYSARTMTRHRKSEAAVSAANKRLIDKIYAGDLPQDFNYTYAPADEYQSLQKNLGLSPETFTSYLNMDPDYATHLHTAEKMRRAGEYKKVDVSTGRKLSAKESAGGEFLNSTESVIFRSHHNNLQPWDCRIDNLRWVAGYDLPAAIGDGQVSACGSKKSMPGICLLKTGQKKFNLTTNDLSDMYAFFEKKFEQETRFFTLNSANHTIIPVKELIHGILHGHNLSTSADELLSSKAKEVTAEQLKDRGKALQLVTDWYLSKDEDKYDGIKLKPGIDSEKRLEHSCGNTYNLQDIADTLQVSIGFVSERYKVFRLKQKDFEVVDGIYDLIDKLRTDVLRWEVRTSRPRELAAEGKIRYVLCDQKTADTMETGSGGGMGAKEFIAAGGNKHHTLVMYNTAAVSDWLFCRWVEQRKEFKVNYVQLKDMLQEELGLKVSREKVVSLLKDLEFTWERDIGDVHYNVLMRGVNTAALEASIAADKAAEDKEVQEVKGFDWDNVSLSAETDDEDAVYDD